MYRPHMPLAGRVAASCAFLVLALTVLVGVGSPADARPVVQAAAGPPVWSFRVEGDAAAQSGVAESRFVAIDRRSGPLPESIRLVGVPSGPSKTSE